MFEFIKEFKWWIIGLLVIVLLAVVPNFHVEEHKVEIVKTEIVNNGGHYMIFCKEKGENVTYTLDDSFWHWSWNTSDIYGSLEVGKTYKIKTSGFRIPIISWYKNIYKITPVE